MKKVNFYINVVLIIGAVAFFSACTKKDPNPTITSGTDSVKLEFFHTVSGEGLNMNKQWYKNANGDSFKVTVFNYYISNITLKGVNGTADYTEANSYHLVKADSMSGIATAVDLRDVPLGEYAAITFTIGVDSLHNVSGAQTGALDPINGMFWSWNTGYIMLKFEGLSPQSVNTTGYIEFHCGGFSGPNSVLKTVTLPLTANITTNKYQEPHVHISADVATLFKAPNKISFAAESEVNTPGLQAKQIADNYAGMFTVTYAGF